MEREPVGIEGFDKLIEGGFPKGNSVLITGAPGTGKSIFSMHFLHTGATEYGQKGLYISFEQNIEDLYNQAEQFGMDFRKLEAKGLVKFIFIDISQRQLAEGETHIDLIKREIQTFNPSRVVVDSLSPLANIPIAPDELMSYGLVSDISSFMPTIPQELMTRFQVHRLIMVLKKMPVTSIVISEIPKESKWLSADHVSEFMADGVILLTYEQAETTMNRTLSIEKMRATRHEESIMPMHITSKGIVIKRPESIL